MRRQNFPDGVNREQAVYYHHYALEYLVMGMRLLERLGPGGAGGPPDPRPADAVLRRRHDRRRRSPDADRGCRRRSRHGPQPRDRRLSLRVAALDGLGPVRRRGVRGPRGPDRRLARPARPWSTSGTAYWHGQPARALPSPATGDRRWVFPEGGYLVSRSEGVTLVFRAGPFGYPSIAAHAHCDQLSVLLRLGADHGSRRLGHGRLPHRGPLEALLPGDLRPQHGAGGWAGPGRVRRPVPVAYPRQRAPSRRARGARRVGVPWARTTATCGSRIP